MSRQPENSVHKNSSRVAGYLLVALFIEVIALYFGFKGMDFLFGECSYSLVPFFVVLLLAILGLVAAIVSTVKLFRGWGHGTTVFGIIVTILCAVIGCYSVLAASLTFCF
jgi:hypothetical protein